MNNTTKTQQEIEQEMLEMSEQFSTFLHTKGIKAKFKLAFSNMKESAKKQHVADVAEFEAVKAQSAEDNKEFVEFLHTKGIKEKYKLVIENIKKGIHVMIACPGFTASNVRFSALTADGSQQGETPRNEAKMMTPERVAHLVARGIKRRKRLCLMEWEGRMTHLLKKFFPGLVDRLFYMVMAREPDSPLNK